MITDEDDILLYLKNRKKKVVPVEEVAVEQNEDYEYLLSRLAEGYALASRTSDFTTRLSWGRVISIYNLQGYHEAAVLVAKHALDARTSAPHNKPDNQRADIEAIRRMYNQACTLYDVSDYLSLNEVLEEYNDYGYEHAVQFLEDNIDDLCDEN